MKERRNEGGKGDGTKEGRSKERRKEREKDGYKTQEGLCSHIVVLLNSS